MKIEIFTDGACRGNPGPGGWAALIRGYGTEKTIRGFEAETTNNRMELMAAISGLQGLTRACEVILYTDSQYLCFGMTRWLSGWKKKGWRTTQGPVKNKDLWELLDQLAQKHKIQWCWIKAHNGHPENEYVDQQANLAIDDRLILDK